MQQGLRAALAICVAGAIGVAAGCGGGGDDSASVTRTIAGRTITAPALSTTTGARTRPDSTTTQPLPQTFTIPGVGTVHASDLAPFRACLRRHGVQPLALDNAQPDPGLTSQERIAKLRALIRAQLPARTACAPELPPALRNAFEQFRKRIQGAGGPAGQ